MGTPLGPKYVPYTYMDPLGKGLEASCSQAAAIPEPYMAILSSCE